MNDNEKFPVYTPPFDLEEWWWNLEITPEVVIVSGMIVIILALMFGPINKD